MKPSSKCFDLIKREEGLRLDAYLDQVGVPTIGYGNTFFPDGKKVQIGNKITKDFAEAMLQTTVTRFAEAVAGLIKKPVNQNQFDALVSFAYNVGTAALSKSTLLKFVNANPDEPMIRGEFQKWIKAGGRILPGLVRRRKNEADLYFTQP